MRVLLAGDGPNFFTGYAKIIKNLARQFKKRGIEVGLMSLQSQGAPLAWVDNTDIYPVYGGAEIPNGMAKSFKDFSPDILIHVRDAFYGSSSHFQFAYRVMTVPYCPKNVILYSPVQNDLLPDAFLDVALNDCSFLVTMTKWSMEILQFEGYPVKRMDYAYAGFDPDIFKPEQAKRKKEDYGLDPSKLTISYVALSSQPRKAFPTLIKATSIVRRKYDVELYLHTSLAGMASDIPHFVKKYGMSGLVVIPQNASAWGVDDEILADIYRLSTLYCSPSAEEGFDMPLLEAYATGTACVATDHPNHREVVGSNHVFLSPAHREAPTAWSWGWYANAEELARGIELMIDENDDKKKEREKEQVERARSIFTWERVAEKWIQIFREHEKEWGIKVP